MDGGFNFEADERRRWHQNDEVAHFRVAGQWVCGAWHEVTRKNSTRL